MPLKQIFFFSFESLLIYKTWNEQWFPPKKFFCAFFEPKSRKTYCRSWLTRREPGRVFILDKSRDVTSQDENKTARTYVIHKPKKQDKGREALLLWTKTWLATSKMNGLVSMSWKQDSTETEGEIIFGNDYVDRQHFNDEPLAQPNTRLDVEDDEETDQDGLSQAVFDATYLRQVSRWILVTISHLNSIGLPVTQSYWHYFQTYRRCDLIC